MSSRKSIFYKHTSNSNISQNFVTNQFDNPLITFDTEDFTNSILFTEDGSEQFGISHGVNTSFNLYIGRWDNTNNVITNQIEINDTDVIINDSLFVIGNVSAQSFIGDGSFLTGISAGGGNPFDQSLNKSDNVTFFNLTLLGSFNFQINVTTGQNPLIDNQTITNLSLFSSSRNITFESDFTHIEIDNLTSPYDELVGYWNFDGDEMDTENFISYDFSQYDNDGLASGNAHINSSDCLYEFCLKVDGLNDVVVIPDSDSLYQNDTMTLSLWLKSGVINDNFANIISKAQLNTFGWYYSVNNFGSGTSFRFDTSAGVNQNPISTVSGVINGEWNHVVFVIDKNNITYYQNGTFLQSALYLLGEGFNTTQGLFIGEREDTSNDFNGSVDEIMIFNTTLTASEVLDIFNNQSSKYYQRGELDYNNIFVNQTNFINITLNDCNTGLDSNILIDVNEQGEQALVNCQLNNYNLGGFVEDINVTLISNSSTSSFFSPITISNFTLDWLIFSTGADSIKRRIINLSETGFNFNDNIDIDNNSITGIFELNFSNGDTISGNSSIDFFLNNTLRVSFSQNSSLFIGDVDNIDNIDGFSRFSETNLNSGTSAIAGFTAQNDVNDSIFMIMTGSNYANSFINSRQGGIFSVSDNDQFFANGYDRGFMWINNIVGNQLFSSTTHELMSLSNLSTLSIINVNVNEGVIFNHTTTPSAISGAVRVYSKDDNRMYITRDDGTERRLIDGGVGSIEIDEEIILSNVTILGFLNNTFVGGSAYVCIYDNGTLATSEGGCA